jgi:hypothetical protein
MTWKTERSQFEIEVGKKHDAEGGVPVHEVGDIAIGGRWGRFVRWPQRALAYIDDFMKTITAHGEAEASAYRIAKSEGHKGDALSERIEELTTDLQSEAWSEAVEESHRLAFQAKPGPLLKGALKSRRVMPGLRYMFPFITTPGNIFKEGIKLSPLGIARPLINKHMTDKWGITPAMIAEQAVAWTLLYAFLGNDPDDPWITGAPPTDYKKKGPYPYTSVKLGGNWYNYGRIEPFATGLALVVDTAGGFWKAKPGSSFTSPVESLAGQAGDKTFLAGVSDIMRIAHDPGKELPQWASRFTTSWIPNIVRSSSRNADAEYNERRIWGKGDEWLKHLARRTGQNTELRFAADLPKVDLWGRNVYRSHPQSTLISKMIAPIKSKPDSDIFIADRLLVRWNNAHPYGGYRPIAPSPMKSDKTYMTEKEYHDYCLLSGTIARKILKGELIDTDDPTQDDIDTIKHALKEARKIAKQHNSGDTDAIAEEIVQARIAAKRKFLKRKIENIPEPSLKAVKASGMKRRDLLIKRRKEFQADIIETRRWFDVRNIPIRPRALRRVR